MTNFCTRPEPLPESVELRAPLVRLEGVGLNRGEKTVLTDVNLTIGCGDFVAVTGPNGGGKTTLMRIILGLLKPTQGRVVFNREAVNIGYLPQKSHIDTSYPISVREVVASGLLRHGSPHAAERRLTVDRTLDLVELTPHASKPIGAMSGGQQQRALLARAIISRPQMLVLDEPFSYIDKHFEQRIYEIIGSLAPTTTILLVSHEIDRIATMANRHLIVDRKVGECRSAHHFMKVALCE